MNIMMTKEDKIKYLTDIDMATVKTLKKKQLIELVRNLIEEAYYDMPESLINSIFQGE